MIFHILVAICIIIVIAYVGQILSMQTQVPYTKFVINWFVLLIIVNISITTFILISYRYIRFRKGKRGPTGHRGVQGAQGREGSCTMCQPALPSLKQIRPEKLTVRFAKMHHTDQKKLFPLRKHDGRFTIDN